MKLASALGLLEILTFSPDSNTFFSLFPDVDYPSVGLLYLEVKGVRLLYLEAKGVAVGRADTVACISYGKVCAGLK